MTQSSGLKKMLGQANVPVVRRNVRSSASVSWGTIADDVIADLVRIAASNGAAIMFGVTSDSGAFSLCVLDKENKIKEYPHSEQEVDDFRAWLRDEYFGFGSTTS